MTPIRSAKTLGPSESANGVVTATSAIDFSYEAHAMRAAAIKAIPTYTDTIQAAQLRARRPVSTASPIPSTTAHHRVKKASAPRNRATGDASSSDGNQLPSVVALAVVSRA